ncbi:MAG TPA: ABC transporter substrate-binding protein [Burkholderiales bacterium]|nr:ABC transporter substrate-binding protein [Burkholderiales bacterium]
MKFLLAGLLMFAASAQAQITVYCSIIDEQCRAGVAAFERSSGTKVSMVRKGTGEIYAQIRAEASSPRGDVWWGGPGDPHMQAAEEGLLEEYKSPRLAELHPWAVRLAELSRYRTTGIYLGALGMGYNTEVLKKKNIPAPKCWADLLDAKFRDEVQIADPNSSGTAYVMLATMVQLMGEDKGFAYLKALHRNVNQYTKSGIAPVKSTASGENGVGIAFLHDMVTMRVQGAPIQTVAPCEGTGYEIGAVSLIKGRKNAEAARRFVDWTLSAEAQKVVGVDQNIYSIPSNKAAPVHAQAPNIASIKLINYDSAKYGSSAERNRLLKKWGDEVKALPK